MRGDREALDEGLDLLLEPAYFHRALPATVIEAALAAVVIGVAGAEAVRLVFGRHGEAALAAFDEAREGEVLLLAPRLRLASEDILHPVPFVPAHDRRILARIEASLPRNESRVEGAPEDLVDRGEGEGPSALFSPLQRPEAAGRHDVVDAAWRVR